MPFESRFARAFTAVNIEREAPAASGVYGISNNAKSWIFIDETENIRGSLMEYLAISSESPTNQPSGFSFELSPSYNPHATRRDRLVAELAPIQKRRPRG